jgi:hypothetical protein
MSLPYESSTAGDSALRDVHRVLEKFGCQNFGTMIDIERQAVIVTFKYRGSQVQVEASYKGYAAAWLRRHPWNGSRMRGNRADYEQKALAGYQAGCRAMREKQSKTKGRHAR